MIEKDDQRHVWGLGRHFLGSNYFWYLKDPAGNFSEYYSDMDCIDEDVEWVPEVWEGQKSFYSWGPPPPKQMREPEDLAALMVGAHSAVIDKIRDDVLAMLDVVPDGSSIAVGGFGLTGAPIMLCDALCDLGKKDLHIVANNAGIDPYRRGAPGPRRAHPQVHRVVPVEQEASSRCSTRATSSSSCVPQGTLAERMRAAGAGHPGVLHADRCGHRPRHRQLPRALRHRRQRPGVADGERRAGVRRPPLRARARR